MQFFAYTTAILMVYIRRTKIGKTLLSSSIIGFTIISFVTHIKHDFSIKLDVMNNLMSAVYIVPWTRVAPYLMGTLTAIHVQEKGGRFELSQVGSHANLNLCSKSQTVLIPEIKISTLADQLHLRKYCNVRPLLQKCFKIGSLIHEDFSPPRGRIRILLGDCCRCFWLSKSVREMFIKTIFHPIWKDYLYLVFTRSNRDHVDLRPV